VLQENCLKALEKSEYNHFSTDNKNEALKHSPKTCNLKTYNILGPQL
jgi:hypothetical protein